MSKDKLAKLVCEWCGKIFTHNGIYKDDIGRYGKGGGVVCPHCWRFTNPNPKFWVGNIDKD